MPNSKFFMGPYASSLPKQNTTYTACNWASAVTSAYQMQSPNPIVTTNSFYDTKPMIACPFAKKSTTLMPKNTVSDSDCKCGKQPAIVPYPLALTQAQRNVSSYLTQNNYETMPEYPHHIHTVDNVYCECEPEAPLCPEPEVPMCPEPEVPLCPEPEVPLCPESEVPLCPEPEAPLCPEPEAPLCPEAEYPICTAEDLPFIAPVYSCETAVDTKLSEEAAYYRSIIPRRRNSVVPVQYASSFLPSEPLDTPLECQEAHPCTCEQKEQNTQTLLQELCYIAEQAKMRYETQAQYNQQIANDASAIPNCPCRDDISLPEPACVCTNETLIDSPTLYPGKYIETSNEFSDPNDTVEKCFLYERLKQYRREKKTICEFLSDYDEETFYAFLGD